MLTFITNSDIRGITKTYRAEIAPESSAIFLYPFKGDENPNILNKGQSILDVALVESPTYSYLGGNTKTSRYKMNNLVYLNNNRVSTTSLRVAEVFGKQHKNIIQKIDSLLKEVPQNFNELNFKPVEYIDEKGEKRRAFEISKDGFVLLAMGFTGKKAMEFKLQYINAFNLMEKALLNPSFAPVVSIDQHPETMKVIGGMVKRCVSKAFRDELSNMTREDNFYLCVNIFDKLIASIKKKAYEQARIDERKKITDLLQAMQ